MAKASVLTPRADDFPRRDRDRDLADATGTPVRRTRGRKEPVAPDTLSAVTADTLAEDQALPLDQAPERRTSRTSDVTSVAGAVEAVTAGSRARIPWAAPGADGGREPAGHR
ncbi:hypothetical protein ACFWPV_32630 [Streptomyces uncialis]|uniref:hypothetical protein n=1 Tax=Streptomyces uncialis TaxID=1048205 RepID=UPI003649B4F2